MITTIIIFILILSLLVFVHELGHFVTAKKMGVKVEEFGFGFPPRAFGIKRGETIYSINWIPLGGFVKIKGETGEFRDEKDSFAGKKIWQRGVILSAGVLMNYLLCIVLLSVGFIIGLPQVIDGESGNAMIRDAKIQIVEVLASSPAAKADLKLGDVIVKIDNQPVETVEAMQNYLNERVGQPIQVEVIRGKETVEKEATPIKLEETGKGGLGVGLVRTGIVSYPWYSALKKGTVTTLAMTKEILIAFYNLIKDLAVTHKAVVDVAGPVGIAVLTGQVARMGFIYILQFIALLSLNLAIINFFPFPALDGGRFLFLIIEKIRRRPIDQKIEAIVHTIGFSLLMLLVVLVTYRDIAQYSDKFVNLWHKIIR